MSNHDIRQTDLRMRRMRWKRCFLVTWPALVSLGLGAYFYFLEIHATLFWLIQNRHPMNDWMGYFEMDNQIFPLFILMVITILLLLQKEMGTVLLLLGTFFFTAGGTIRLVQNYLYDSPYISNPLIDLIDVVIGFILSIGIFISLVMIVSIDGKLLQWKKNSPQDRTGGRPPR